MARGQHNWSEQRKAAVLAAVGSGVSVAETSSTYDVPERTIRNWISGNGADIEVLAPKVADEKKLLADKLEEVAHLLINAAPDKIADASLTGTITSFGIAVDKMRLLREQSTQITESVRTQEEADQMILAILMRGLERLECAEGRGPLPPLLQPPLTE